MFLRVEATFSRDNEKLSSSSTQNRWMTQRFENDSQSVTFGKCSDPVCKKGFTDIGNVTTSHVTLVNSSTANAQKKTITILGSAM